VCGLCGAWERLIVGQPGRHTPSMAGAFDGTNHGSRAEAGGWGSFRLRQKRMVPFAGFCLMQRYPKSKKSRASPDEGFSWKLKTPFSHSACKSPFPEDLPSGLKSTNLTRVFGYREEEVSGRSLEILIPLPLRALHQRHVRAFAASSEVGRATGHRGAKRTKERLPLGRTRRSALWTRTP
jgi:hypothetical protein